MRVSSCLRICALLGISTASGQTLTAEDQGYVPWNEENDYFTQTIAGSLLGDSDGVGVNASFASPVALALDSVSNMLYVADRGNHRLRALNLTGLEVTTVAGSTAGYRDGAALASKFSSPSGVAVDAYSQVLFISDTANNLIRKLELRSGQVSTLAGSVEGGFVDGRAQAAAFSYPLGLAFSAVTRQLFVCDAHNHAIRVIHVDTKEVRTLAGVDEPGTADGPGADARFILPQSATLDEELGFVFVVDSSARLRRVDMMDEPSYPSRGYSALSGNVVTLFEGGGDALFEGAGVTYAYGWKSLLISDSPPLGRGSTFGSAAAGQPSSRILRFVLTPPPSPPTAPPPMPEPPSSPQEALVYSLNGSNSSGFVVLALPPPSLPEPPSPPPPSPLEPAYMPGLPPGHPPPPPPRSSGPYATVGVAEGDQLCQQGEALGAACNTRLLWLAGASEGYRDGMGTESRYYHPTGLAASHHTQSLYVADSHNHLIRIMDLTDRKKAVEEDVAEWSEVAGKALFQNLVFILILVGSLVGTAITVFLCCRHFPLCPVQKKRLHEKRVKNMLVGQRM